MTQKVSCGNHHVLFKAHRGSVSRVIGMLSTRPLACGEFSGQRPALFQHRLKWTLLRICAMELSG